MLLPLEEALDATYGCLGTPSTSNECLSTKNSAWIGDQVPDTATNWLRTIKTKIKGDLFEKKKNEKKTHHIDNENSLGIMMTPKTST